MRGLIYLGCIPYLTIFLACGEKHQVDVTENDNRQIKVSPPEVTPEEKALNQLQASMPILAQAYKYVPMKPVKRSRATAQKMRMPSAFLDIPCNLKLDGHCIIDALSYSRLRLSRLQDMRQQQFSTYDASRHFRISVFGNSLIASDHIIDVIRDTFQHHFGDGGRGWMLADRMAEYGRRTRTGKYARGFKTHNIAMGSFGEYPHGLAGVLHVAPKHRSASATFFTKKEKIIRPFIESIHIEESHQPRLVGQDFVMTIDSVKGHGQHSIPIPEHVEKVKLTGKGGYVVHGLSLEMEQPGVIVDTFGVPAADFVTFEKRDPALVRKQLSALDSDLIIFSLGGNEIKRLAWGKRTLKKIEEGIEDRISEIRSILPRAECIIIGPIENIYPLSQNPRYITRKQLKPINQLFKTKSLELGCAYWNTFEAMGGRGAIKKLAKRGWMHDDMVHPRRHGLDLIGYLFADAFMKEIENTSYFELGEEQLETLNTIFKIQEEDNDKHDSSIVVTRLIHRLSEHDMTSELLRTHGYLEGEALTQKGKQFFLQLSDSINSKH